MEMSCHCLHLVRLTLKADAVESSTWRSRLFAGSLVTSSASEFPRFRCAGVLMRRRGEGGCVHRRRK
eukprot:1342250-Amphidinium_carterae.1